MGLSIVRCKESIDSMGLLPQINYEETSIVRDEHDYDELVNYEETGTVSDEHDYDEPVNYEETGRVRDEQINYAESPLALMYISKSTLLVMICQWFSWMLLFFIYDFII